MKILDACCGSRMFWYEPHKNRSDTVYMDCREIDETLCDGRKLVVKPDLIADFRRMPFEDNTFDLVVFDPPHLIRAGKNSWLVKKYGKLDKATWRDDIKRGFDECLRVLKETGVLVFKWSDAEVPIKDVLATIGRQPLFGDKQTVKATKYWMVFVKIQ